MTIASISLDGNFNKAFFRLATTKQTPFSLSSAVKKSNYNKYQRSDIPRYNKQVVVVVVVLRVSHSPIRFVVVVVGLGVSRSPIWFVVVVTLVVFVFFVVTSKKY